MNLEEKIAEDIRRLTLSHEAFVAEWRAAKDKSDLRIAEAQKASEQRLKQTTLELKKSEAECHNCPYNCCFDRYSLADVQPSIVIPEKPNQTPEPTSTVRGFGHD